MKMDEQFKKELAKTNKFVDKVYDKMNLFHSHFINSLQLLQNVFIMYNSIGITLRPVHGSMMHA